MVSNRPNLCRLNLCRAPTAMPEVFCRSSLLGSCRALARWSDAGCFRLPAVPMPRAFHGDDAGCAGPSDITPCRPAIPSTQCRKWHFRPNRPIRMNPSKRPILRPCQLISESSSKVIPKSVYRIRQILAVIPYPSSRNDSYTVFHPDERVTLLVDSAVPWPCQKAG